MKRRAIIMQNDKLGLGRADHTLSIRVWGVGEKVQAKRAKKKSCLSQPTCAVTDRLLQRR